MSSDQVTFKNCPACNSTHVTRNGDVVSCTCGFEEYAGKWDSVPRRGDGIAAQGGTADRDLVGSRVEIVNGTYNEHWGIGCECYADHPRGIIESENKEHTVRLKLDNGHEHNVSIRSIKILDRGDFNSAVPSVPGGVDRVKAAFKAFETSLVMAAFNGNLSLPDDTTKAIAALCESVKALGAPQGSDTLTVKINHYNQWLCERIERMRAKALENGGNLKLEYFGRTDSLKAAQRRFREMFKPSQLVAVGDSEGGNAA